jgi:hypothetical protein
LTVLASALVVVFLSQILVVKNPTQTKATTFDSTTPAGNRTMGTTTDYSNDDVIIDGVIVTITGPHTFRNLTIKNNGKLVHDPLVRRTDTNYDGNITASGSGKKIEITVTQDLKLENNAKINADAKGFPGGEIDCAEAAHNRETACDGWGPGGGQGYSIYESGTSGGGGGYGGEGGDGSNPGGGEYGLADAPFQHGSGGGTARRRNNNRIGWGGAGGGIIRVTAGTIAIDSTSSITANGGDGTADYRASGGGGAGGTVWLTASALITEINAGLSPNASGGDGGNDGESATVSYGGISTERNYGSNIQAKGGNTVDNNARGGGGGGGRIRLEFNSVTQLCTITSSSTNDWIPPSCVGKDVIIDNKRVWVANGTTPVRYKSLTIRNNGELYQWTNSALTDCSSWNNGSGNQGINIELDTDLILESNGKVTANASGGPGGINGNGGCGPGGGVGKYAAARDQISGGGGFGGVGGSNGCADGSTTCTNGKIYPATTSYSTYDANQFHFGSGGGGVWVVGRDGGADGRTSGGAGGGRIHFRAARIVLNDGSVIQANGTGGGRVNGRDCHDSWLGAATDCDDMPGWSGGGSGGMIWLEASQYQMPSNKANAVATSNGLSGGQYGYILSDIHTPVGIEANGAAGGENTGGGGGGGRIIIKKLSQPAVTISKVLVPYDRPGTGLGFNPYSLQANDVITVELTVSNLVAGIDTEVRDYILATNPLISGASCQIGTINNSVPNDAAKLRIIRQTNETNHVYWKFRLLDPSLNSIKLSYNCTVTRN